MAGCDSPKDNGRKRRLADLVFDKLCRLKDFNETDGTFPWLQFKQTLRAHDGDLSALYLEETLTEMRKRGIVDQTADEKTLLLPLRKVVDFLVKQESRDESLGRAFKAIGGPQPEKPEAGAPEDKVSLQVEIFEEKNVDGASEEKTKADKYMESHDIAKRLSESLEDLLKTKPSNPTEFLCRHLRGECEDGGGKKEAHDESNNAPANPQPKKPEADAATTKTVVRVSFCGETTEIEDYLAHHRIEEHLCKSVEALLKTRPNNATVLLCQSLSRKDEAVGDNKAQQAQAAAGSAQPEEDGKKAKPSKKRKGSAKELLPEDFQELFFELTEIKETATSHELQVLSGSFSGASVCVLRTKGRDGKPAMPTILKFLGNVDSKNSGKEAEEMKFAKQLYGEYAPRLIDHQQIGCNEVLQLEITGGSCCMPSFVEVTDTIGDFTSVFQKALSKDDEELRHRTLSVVREVFFVIVRPSLLSGVGGATTDTITLDTLITVESKFDESYAQAPMTGAYFDGNCLEKEVLEKHGGVLSDFKDLNAGKALLLDMVEKLTGIRQPPTAFFRRFFQDSKFRHMLRHTRFVARFGVTHGDFHTGNVMVDSESRPCLIDFDTLSKKGKGHVYLDAAKFLCSLLFLFFLVTTENEADVRYLLRLIAAAPNDLGMRLPDAPAEASRAVKFLWSLVDLMLEIFHEYARGNATNEKDKAVDSMTGETLQMLSQLLSFAVKLTHYQQNAEYPERKRLALYGAIAFAARLQDEAQEGSAPAWLAKAKEAWKNSCPRQKGGNDTVPLETQMERYLTITACKYGWYSDPFTRKRIPLESETVPLELYSGTGEGSRINGAKELLERYEADGDKALRFVIIGGPGTGKSTLAKQLTVECVEHHKAASGNPTLASPGLLPVHVPLSELVRLASASGDLLESYIVHAYDKLSDIILKARSTGWHLILDGLDEAAREKQQVVNLLETLVKKEPQHRILLLTRPSAVDMDKGKEREKNKEALLTESQLAQWNFNILTLVEFGPEQLTSLCERRLRGLDYDTHYIQKIQSDLAKQDTAICQVPLLATMVIHMLRLQEQSLQKYV
eukprot:TRINITY_DN5069_c0_g1_i1.p1 TRINITY_DN5069_c0_g1~~TRINITY_DN5069_c0_g1_i1.p1  ORF type:complete len:1095 (-),score=230.87 TRINITY_DN5069_c0_g1_i1:67-3288(-)